MSLIILTILLLIITVALVATLVTIHGGFTLGIGKADETASVSVSEVENFQTYTLYLTISASTLNISASSINLYVNGTLAGTLSSPTIPLSDAKSENPTCLNTGSVFEFTSEYEVTSITITYKGLTLFTDNSITIK